MRPLYLIPGVIIWLSLLSCEKAKRNPHDTMPLVHHASFKDSVPAKLYDVVNPKELNGVQIGTYPNKFISYFEYEAEHSVLLREVGKLPFHMSAPFADTLCRSVEQSLLDRANISNDEFQLASFFFNNDPNEYISYECVKPPYKHTLFLSKRSNRVLHRIEKDFS